MTNNVAGCMEALIQALLESEEYQNYFRYEEELNKDSELRRRVDEFRGKNFRLQRQEGIDLFEAVDHLESEYVELRSNALVNAYLEAELTMCKTMQKIHNSLWKEFRFQYRMKYGKRKRKVDGKGVTDG